MNQLKTNVRVKKTFTKKHAGEANVEYYIILNKYIFSQKNQGQSQKRNLTKKGGNQNFDI